ncbi:MAG: aquaporin family protein [Chlamydiae bacterium]|nr:aquaporin family protein [Chlamydiota bacterium]
MSIFWGEFIGTMLLILLGNGSVANVLLTGSKGKAGGWIVISCGWGFAVTAAVYVTGWVSGAHINPAVTLALCFIGKSSLATLPYYLSGQLLGAMFGATLVWIIYGPHWKKTEDLSAKLSCFCTQPAIRSFKWNFLSECLSTAILLLGILGIMDAHNNLVAGVGPLAVGFLVFSLLLSLGGPTGVAINPARDLGPRIMHAMLPLGKKRNSDWSYSLIPVAAPILGGCLGSGFYKYFISMRIPFEGFIR